MIVHNHGSEEGEGLSCNELRLPDGTLQGRCLDGLAVCRDGYCPETTPIHQWKNSRWFFQKNGWAFCPKHIPAWVEEWRNNKK